MKPIKSINVSVFIFFFCIFCAGFWGTVTGQESEPDYYFVDGQKIILKPSQNYSALKVKPGTSDAEMKTFKADIDSAGFGTVEDSPVLQKYNIVLIRIKQDVGPDPFRTGTKSFRKKKGVESEIPVYGVGGINQVLVNEFIVQFKSEVSEEEIAQSLKEKNAKSLEKTKK